MAKKKQKDELALAERELMSGMDLTVPVVGEITVIESTMEVYGGEGNKEIIDLPIEDRHELAALFVVKGGMAGVTKKAKEYEEKVKEIGAPWLLARGVKKVKVPGIGTFSLVEGSNNSISADALRKVLVKHIAATIIPDIIKEATKVTPYVSIQFKAD